MTSGVAQTTAESAVMASTAAKFDQVNESLQSMLSTLMSELSVLSHTWKGQGANAFEHVKQKYADDLRRLNQALAETAQSIRESATGYDASDAEAASRLTQSSGDLSLPL